MHPPRTHLLRHPLDYVFADHFRQRVLCSVLDQIFDADILDPELTHAVYRFLKDDLKYHIADEEENLFPILRKRAEPDDQIDEILDQLSEEHKSDHIDAKQILRELEYLLDGTSSYPISFEVNEMAHRFTSNERHRLILENAIVMPLAKVRFTSDDLSQMGQEMATRRGLDYPEASDVN
jgi:hemerythrin-like domain-containing protein